MKVSWDSIGAAIKQIQQEGKADSLLTAMVLASYDPNSNEKKNVMRSHEMILKILFQRKHSADIIENLIKAGRFLGVDIRLNLEAYIGRISRDLRMIL